MFPRILEMNRKAGVTLVMVLVANATPALRIRDTVVPAAVNRRSWREP